MYIYYCLVPLQALLENVKWTALFASKISWFPVNLFLRNVLIRIDQVSDGDSGSVLLISQSNQGLVVLGINLTNMVNKDQLAPEVIDNSIGGSGG